jgi:hypothetical protein
VARSTRKRRPLARRTSTPRPAPSPRALARRSLPAEVIDWKTDREIARITGEILSIEAEGARKSAESLVQIGRRIAAVQQRLPYGQWTEWVDDRLPYTPRTAERYIALHEWSQLEPAEFHRLKHLGPAKLYVIMALPEPRRRGLVPAKTITYRGTKKTLATLTRDEMLDLFGFKASPAPDIAIEKVVQGARIRIAKLDTFVDMMIKRKLEVVAKHSKKVRHEVRAVLEKLDHAFGS